MEPYKPRSKARSNGNALCSGSFLETSLRFLPNPAKSQNASARSWGTCVQPQARSRATRAGIASLPMLLPTKSLRITRHAPETSQLGKIDAGLPVAVGAEFEILHGRAAGI